MLPRSSTSTAHNYHRPYRTEIGIYLLGRDIHNAAD